MIEYDFFFFLNLCNTNKEKSFGNLPICWCWWENLEVPVRFFARICFFYRYFVGSLFFFGGVYKINLKILILNDWSTENNQWLK